MVKPPRLPPPILLHFLHSEVAILLPMASYFLAYAARVVGRRFPFHNPLAPRRAAGGASAARIAGGRGT